MWKRPKTRHLNLKTRHQILQRMCPRPVCMAISCFQESRAPTVVTGSRGKGCGVHLPHANSDRREGSTKTGKQLPKNAAVCAQWVRCGKAECACVEGPGHGPYWYLFWRERGRLCKRYLRRAEAEQLQEEFARRRSERRRFRRLMNISKWELSDLRGFVREAEAGR